MWYSIAVVDGILTLLYIITLRSELYALNGFWVGVGINLLLMASLISLFLFTANWWNGQKGKIKRLIGIVKWVFVLALLLSWSAYLIVVYFAHDGIRLAMMLPEMSVFLVWILEIAFLELVLSSCDGGNEHNVQEFVAWILSIIALTSISLYGG